MIDHKQILLVYSVFTDLNVVSVLGILIRVYLKDDWLLSLDRLCLLNKSHLGVASLILIELLGICMYT